MELNIFSKCHQIISWFIRVNKYIQAKPNIAKNINMQRVITKRLITSFHKIISFDYANVGGIHHVYNHTAYNNKKNSIPWGKKIDKRTRDALKQNIAAIQSRHGVYENSPKTTWATLKLNNIQVYLRQRSNEKSQLLYSWTCFVFSSLNAVFYSTAHLWSGKSKIRLWMPQEEVKSSINLVRMRCLRRKVICPANIGHEKFGQQFITFIKLRNYWTE